VPAPLPAAALDEVIRQCDRDLICGFHLQSAKAPPAATNLETACMSTRVGIRRLIKENSTRQRTLVDSRIRVSLPTPSMRNQDLLNPNTSRPAQRPRDPGAHRLGFAPIFFPSLSAEIFSKSSVKIGELY
jgi:hypothetical protein